MPQPKVYSLIDKAIYDYSLIKNGDRILLGVSGGKDSTLLAEYLSNRKKRRGESFDFFALNIASSMSGELPVEIKKLFGEWGVPFESIFIDIAGRLKAPHKLNCYWCSLCRRSELNNYAQLHGYNKLALAHHADDVLETFLMNALDKCTLSTMVPLLHYDKYPVEVIRPLYYVEESQIIDYAKRQGFFGHTCTCSHQSASLRKVARSRLEALCQGDSRAKSHLLQALQNAQLQYLPTLSKKS